MKITSTRNPNYMIPDYFKNPVIRPYLKNVRDWQGYIRFLGLPDRRDNPDIIIDRLFVPPLLTRRYVSPDENPENWADEAETLVDALVEDSPLVLLGDPGIGKSTFLNYVAWLLSRPATNALLDRLGWHLPLPMVLRELPVQGVKDFDGLLEAFLSRKMSAPLLEEDRRYLMQTLEEGRAFLLLDGIDELGGREARENLRSAVFDGVSRYPACRWLLTSRIVGYEKVPFDREHDRPDEGPFPDESAGELHEAFSRKGSRKLRHMRRESGSGRVAIRYIAPFDDRRIAAFARNWYVQREAATTRAEASANHLVRAVHADGSILRLARVPNLLTMMALIHRIEATLPHGRALLYERIAEAYLESIDKFRGIDASPHELPRKKGWLARVAFEMQRRRISEGGSDETAILMDANTVKGWLSEEMERSDTYPDTPSAEEFLKIIGRRSGLFLPRGEGRYAFVHLSFQEYFAAVALKREVTRFRWAKRNASRLGFDRDMLASWAGQSVWRETFAFLFELLASEEEDDWHADLLDCVFGENFSRLTGSGSDEVPLALGHLLARLVVNSRSGLSSRKRDNALTHCVNTQLRMQSHMFFANIFDTLLGSDADLNTTVFKKIEARMKQTESRALNLSGTRISDLSPITNLTMLESLALMRMGVSDISPLAGLAGLQSLDLMGTGVSDISPLAGLAGLQSLYLMGTGVSDISPLAGLAGLQSLYLMGTGVSDISPLAGLAGLQSLDLMGTGVSDISPLAGLAGLQSLDLMGTGVSDISPLAGLTGLQSLDLMGTGVSDISPLAGLTELQSLDLRGTGVSDISPLAGLTELQSLDLRGTGVSDISPLAGLTELQSLDLMETGVSDISPLAGLTGLQSLDLMGTGVSDISPLAGLTELQSLDLMETGVSDISPLAGLTGLQSLDLMETGVSDISPLAGLTELQSLDLRGTGVSDISPLAGLTELQSLELSDTKVPAGKVEDLRKCRPDIHISYSGLRAERSGTDGLGPFTS